MGAFIKSNGNKVAYGIKDLILDFDEDLEKLNKKALVVGTTVFIISSSKHYILNSAKEWKKIDPLGSGTGTFDTMNLDAGSIDK